MMSANFTYIVVIFLHAEAMIKCQARSRIEERLEVTLTGAMPGVSSAHELAKIRAVSPFDKRPHSQSTGVIVEGLIRFFALLEGFVLCTKENAQSYYLIAQSRHQMTSPVDVCCQWMFFSTGTQIGKSMIEISCVFTGYLLDSQTLRSQILII